ncbi:hypothetical protein [Glaciecola sp. MF2-115]|uniref:hypothetical protein n=1 Tax=Glaciecola sp. MF2-115 TaxID=3384827 RepID=UPI0039A0201C
MNKYKLNKKYPFTKKRSDASIEKLANSFVGISDKLWAAIFVSVILIPLAGIVKRGFERPTEPLNLDALKIFVDTNLILLMCIIFVGVLVAYKNRNIGLDLFDYLDKAKANKRSKVASFNCPPSRLRPRLNRRSK